MSAGQELRVDDPTLERLLEWTYGFLNRKRAAPLPPGEVERREHNFTLDLWTGMWVALTELQFLRQSKLCRICKSLGPGSLPYLCEKHEEEFQRWRASRISIW